jgi:hypothetical protein
MVEMPNLRAVASPGNLCHNAALAARLIKGCRGGDKQLNSEHPLQTTVL